MKISESLGFSCQQRRYVAQVIEILLFNELLLAPREPVEEGELE